MIDSETSPSCDDVSTRLQSSMDGAVQTIDYYISSGARTVLADCTLSLCDSPNQWHIQAIIRAEMWRDVGGWLSKAPLPLIGETRLQLCLTREG